MRLLESLENPAMNGKTITKQSASTCQWLLKASEYDEWLNAEISKDNRDFLWIKGHPGTGKSTLMKFLSKTLKARRKKGNAVISFFFHARGVELAKSTVGMYRSLLKQLLHALPRLQGILDSFDMSQQSKETPDWNLADLKSLFKKAIAQLGDSSLIILIDALDECEESQIRDMVKFLLCVGQKAQNKGIVLRICFASRFYPNISINEQRGIDLDLTSHVGHGQDMKTYINNELEGTIQEPETLQTISDSLMEKAQGVFLWLQLVVPRVVRAFDHGRLEDVELLIQKTPGKLYEVFKQMIEREPKPSAELLLCLQWILFARQPLSPAQLRDAILSGSRTKTPESAWFYSIHNKKKEFREAIIDKFIIDSSKGLAETIESGGEKIVQFIHESVRNFLLESAYWAGCLKDYWPGFLQNFKGKSHNTLKQCCTRYIRLSAPRVDSCTVYDPKKDEMFRNDAMYKFPLLEYVVGNILHHADTAEGSGVDQEAFVCEAEGSGVDQEAFVCEAEGSGASQEASVHEADGTAVSQEASVHEADGTAVSQDLCVGEGFPRCEWIKLQRLLSIYDSRRHVSSARLLYILSEHNAANLINRHPCKSNGFEQGDERYCMPLLAAVFAESHQARGALMRAYANAIMDARRHKLHAICDKFLAGEKKRRPRLTISTLRRKSVLCNVFLAGDESLYNFAVASDLSLEDDGWEALESAAKAGNEDMFNLLLELGADSKKPHNKFALKFSGRTLLWAVKKLWHNGVVRLLRSHADIEYSEEDWLTPLLCAAKQGEPRMVGLLLQFRANSRARDRCYWTPLMWAARLGHQAAVEILLCARASLRHQTAAGEPYQNDNSSITALWCAICQWLHKPRQVLPSSAPQEMDSNSTFSHDDSLMHEIRRVVLINERADVSGPNYAGITPLLVAVFVGDEELARLLIDKGADINWRDQKGATLLMYASFLQPNERLWPRNLIGDIREPTHAMQEGFAKLLIDKKADVNASDADGKTVLMHAVLYGNQWDLQLLLRCDAKVNTSTADGETALTYAVRARNHEALDWLLHSQADTDATTQNRHKALSIARAAGNQEAARLIETYTPGTQYYRDFHHRRSIMLLPSRTKLGGTLN
ncbi:Ankyrin repeat-containing domain protein [Cordyceps fumosorosea ARSEF 2679]|uniref:Ankyrin repeat-containing domain protein n=1 Tax=Cordyceps fumosorosea (strain ARSEF 2679) TaxID=1081104 RepID=A0A168DEH5_CORFA|nr:Ankyrin repeat-containing domain protein [Cordyceps fumosorosea ARSEF 2679]OAA72510.1 Ankyrin repeat-containing domain protein [Cordyceps fumosorosea ARSEF 2679]